MSEVFDDEVEDVCKCWSNRKGKMKKKLMVWTEEIGRVGGGVRIDRRRKLRCKRMALG